MTRPGKNLLILLLSCLFLGACAASSPTSYYMLESPLGPIKAESMPKRSLRVGQVDAPAYLNRNNIVSRVSGQSRLILAEFHLWAEPVGNGVRRIVEELLTSPLMEKGVAVLPPNTEERGDYLLLLDLQRLDGNFNEKAVLECYWTLLDKNDNVLGRGIFSEEEEVRGEDYNILVAAESRLVQSLGSYLAERLPSYTRVKN